jgi:ubiquinone/menaquinone biosynthesis C-methylase UbiE
MDKNSLFQDTNYLRWDQYRDSQNLDARAQLHQRYSSNPEGWFKWVMARMQLLPECQVLECGCGPGWLWRNNLERLPAECQITLTDLSPGMVTEAEEALSTSSRDFRFFDADIATLPFDDQIFDVVVANHMLYHVPDRNKAFAEVQRVLKPNGRFFAATIGKNHMLELWNLRRQLAPKFASNFQQSGKEFALENGQIQLNPWFNQIKLHRYENRLRVTDVEPLLEYVLSSSQARSEVDLNKIQGVRQIVRNRIKEHGSFEITTDSGMFVAVNGGET